MSIHTAKGSVTFLGFGSINVTTDGTIEEQEIEMTIRGYVGDDSLTSSIMATEFVVSSSSDTYTMKLSPSEREKSTYNIANLRFLHAESNPEKTQNAATKYSILISPTQNYLASYDIDDKPYSFKKSGTEYAERTPANTVYYFLCDSNGSELTKATGGQFPSSNQSWTYKIDALYNNPPKNTTTQQYDEKWEIDRDIFLKIDDSSTAQYEPGIYFSYIYFTLMTN